MQPLQAPAVQVTGMPALAMPAAATGAPVVPAAPVVAEPLPVPMMPGKKASDAKADDRGKFRETLWFKKGELDAEAAVAAARAGKDHAPDKADSLPLDERYKDDGSLSRSDKEKYSLRTGGTAMHAAIRDGRESGAKPSLKVSEDALIDEMRGGRGKIVVAIAVGVIVLVLIVVLIAR